MILKEKTRDSQVLKYILTNEIKDSWGLSPEKQEQINVTYLIHQVNTNGDFQLSALSHSVHLHAARESQIIAIVGH